MRKSFYWLFITLSVMTYMSIVIATLFGHPTAQQSIDTALFGILQASIAMAIKN
jgi:hypothetical protein